MHALQPPYDQRHAAVMCTAAALQARTDPGGLRNWRRFDHQHRSIVTQQASRARCNAFNLRNVHLALANGFVLDIEVDTLPQRVCEATCSVDSAGQIAAALYREVSPMKGARVAGCLFALAGTLFHTCAAASWPLPILDEELESPVTRSIDPAFYQYAQKEGMPSHCRCSTTGAVGPRCLFRLDFCKLSRSGARPTGSVASSPAVARSLLTSGTLSQTR